jgi:hypothetical protein
MELLCPLQKQYRVHLSPEITFNCRNQSRNLIKAYFLYAIKENVIENEVKCVIVLHPQK